MASISFDQTGNCIIRVVRGKGKDAPRKTLRIGKVEADYAKEFARHVDRLNNALITDDPPPRATASFVSDLDEKIRGKLAAAGLVPDRISLRGQHTLAPFLDSYLATRTDLKPGTVSKMIVARDDLVSHFGADKPLNRITEADAEGFRRHLKSRASKKGQRRSKRPPEKGKGTEGEKPRHRLQDNTIRRACGRAKEYFK